MKVIKLLLSKVFLFRQMRYCQIFVCIKTSIENISGFWLKDITTLWSKEVQRLNFWKYLNFGDPMYYRFEGLVPKSHTGLKIQCKINLIIVFQFRKTTLVYVIYFGKIPFEKPSLLGRFHLKSQINLIRFLWRYYPGPRIYVPQ